MASPALVRPSPIVYPDSDGKPMSDNTEQFRWLQVLEGNLEALYRDRADVFVAGDLLWYPVEKQPDIRAAGDVIVVVGRPKGYRGSYKQWEEADVPVTVVFEILSPGNTALEMIEKQEFYEEYGVEEYYIFDPGTGRLKAYLRKNDILLRRKFVGEFVSPLMKIRFDLTGDKLRIFYPDGRQFLTLEEMEADRTRQLQRAEAELQRAEVEKRRADDLEARTWRLAELSRKARLNRASPEELIELERLESELLDG